MVSVSDRKNSGRCLSHRPAEVKTTSHDADICMHRCMYACMYYICTCTPLQRKGAFFLFLCVCLSPFFKCHFLLPRPDGTSKQNQIKAQRRWGKHTNTHAKVMEAEQQTKKRKKRKKKRVHGRNGAGTAKRNAPSGGGSHSKQASSKKKRKKHQKRKLTKKSHLKKQKNVKRKVKQKKERRHVGCRPCVTSPTGVSDIRTNRHAHTERGNVHIHTYIKTDRQTHRHTGTAITPSSPPYLNLPRTKSSINYIRKQSKHEEK
ncbi:hypothetical protein MOQ_001624 [Trypanosoma cruzi marinkellei]|uniref:Uncharacterized protein n=1 Tax=Trypanosoma cruzi marinkellei TaxID=85056 RepID=K2MSC0_TRYCR|nr:hypothetical protein MOQ_001624 [Trypanosoma cruzi marinkellei]